MSDHKIPSKIPEQRLAILKAIGGAKGASKTNAELKEIIEERLHRNLEKIVSNMRSLDLLESVKQEGVIMYYGLTEKGKYLLKHASKMVVTPMGEPREYKRRNTKPQEQLPLAPAAPEPIKINISRTANSVADQITDLIDENAQYRKLMLQVYETIGNALGLNEEGEEIDGNSSEA